MKTAYAAVVQAQKALAERPDDLAANAAVGTYLSFWKGDFAAGLPLLAKSEEKPGNVARQELAAGGSGEKLAAAADELRPRHVLR